AETEAAARIVIEVTSEMEVREEKDSLAMLANATNAAAGGLNALRPKEAEINKVTYRHVTLSVGDYKTTLLCKAYSQRYFAELCIKSIEGWVTDNLAQLGW